MADYTPKPDRALPLADGESTSQPRSEPLSDEDIQHIVRIEYTDAETHYESDLAPERAEAIRRYRGDPYGDEEDGRSQVVSTDLRDTILTVLPSLMRIFCGSERVIEFRPRQPEDAEGARQRTDYLNYVVLEDNAGYLELYGAFKEGMLHPFVPVKWWWDDRSVVENETYRGMLYDQVLALSGESDVVAAAYHEDGEVEAPGIAPPVDQLGGPATQSQRVKTYTVRITREHQVNQARFRVVPGEEFLIDRDATRLEDARYVAHRRELSRSELIEMGLDPELVDEKIGAVAFRHRSEEYLVRRGDDRPHERSTGINPSADTALYVEHYLPVDRDGDGRAELTKVCTLGHDLEVVETEDAPEIPFVLGRMDPEPHDVRNTSMHRLTFDVAHVKTSVQRAMLDSLRASIDPRIAIQEDMVSIDDLLNQELGSIIRTQADPNTVMREFSVDFKGREALAVVDYYDTVLESRTGRTRGSAGLDADAMQSTTKAAIAAQLSAAQQRIQSSTRMFAETLVRPLYAGLQRLLMRHQDFERTVRLRGKWVAVDPRTWDAPMDVAINVALGEGTPEDRIAFMQGVVAKQEDLLKTLGPSPLVDFRRYGETLQRATALAGHTNEAEFFGEVPPDWTPPPPPEKPDPQLLLAEAQRRETETRLLIEREKLELDRLRMLIDAETARMKIESDMQIKVLEIEAKAGAQIEESRVSAAVEGMRVRTDAAIRAHEAESAERVAAIGAAAAASAPPASTDQTQGGPGAA